jgi:hypothetical protein
MGRLKNTILGNVTGKVGNIVFRVKGKKSYAYAKPQKVKVSQKQEAKEARSKFTPLSKFGSFINSIPELKYFWKKADIAAGSAYHKISKENYKAFLPTRPTVNNFITPGFRGFCGGDPVTISNIDKSGIRIEAFLKMNEYILRPEETSITALAVICFYSPIKRWGNYFNLDKIIFDNAEIQIDELFEIRLPFTEELQNKYYSYRNSILYFTFITKDKNGRPIRFTMNHKCEFVNEFTKDERKVSDKIHKSKIQKRITDECKEYLKKIFFRGRKGVRE